MDRTVGRQSIGSMRKVTGSDLASSDLVLGQLAYDDWVSANTWCCVQQSNCTLIAWLGQLLILC